MIVYRRRTLYVTTFAEKYPNPSIVIAHFDPREQIDEEGTGQPSYFSVLSAAQTALGLRGECTGIVNTPTATIRLSFALAEDAARVAELVGARVAENGVVAFQYDRALYEKLKATNDMKASALADACRRGEPVQYIFNH